MLRKSVYPWECMDSKKGFDETILPHKENFYSSVNMEDMFTK